MNLFFTVFIAAVVIISSIGLIFCLIDFAIKSNTSRSRPIIAVMIAIVGCSLCLAIIVCTFAWAIDSAIIIETTTITTTTTP